jgi:hypothetical protein
VSLRPKALEYQGWWTFQNLEPIGRHIPLAIPESAFLDRCIALQQVVAEGLSQTNLRLILHKLGVPPAEIEKLRGLKLLDHLVRMAQVAYHAGLELALQGKEVWDRLKKDGTAPAEPIAHLFALHDLRVLASHASANRRAMLEGHLKRFGIAAGETAGGYGMVLDRVYDILGSELRQARSKVDAALSVCNPLVTPPSGGSKAAPVPQRPITNPGKPEEPGQTASRKRRRGRRGGRRRRPDS